ncbi:MAG: hypothetical protein GEV06_23070 [Luteitalea sp.]|nr:hypothetical protein [Luteitalea sp.]
MRGVTTWIGLALAGAMSIGAAAAAAQPPPVGSSRPFEILDNSFLVEEAFNQEPGVFQNIVGFRRTADEWELAFTQEWPIGSQAHQLSFTIPAVGQSTENGIGDVFLHYRFQLTNEAPGRPAISPRLSLILPTGNDDTGLGAGRAGVQVNLPFSQQAGDLYFHWNAGLTYQEQNRASRGTVEDASGFTPHLAASAIWRVKPMAHLMLETTAEFPDELDERTSQAERSASWTVAPGLRGGWNLGDTQIIIGVAVPVVLNDDRTDVSGLVYFSYELPFTRGG